MRPPDKLEQAHAHNANALYQALRTITVSGEAFNVKDLVLHRDVATFTLSSGTIYMYAPVAGHTTGAVFLGEGSIHLEPSSPIERHQLKAVMKTEVLDHHFNSAVFAFTDGTAAELKRGVVGPASATGAAVARVTEMRDVFRNELKYNLEARILEDILSDKPGAFFLAEMKGAAFSKRLIFEVDPHGAIGAAPEEVALLTSNADGYDIALGLPATTLPKSEVHDAFSVSQQTIDSDIAKNGRLTATTVTAITARENNLRVLPFMLAPTLRVSGVWGPAGEALDFIQEDETKDADLAVVLKKPLAADETIQITTSYSGKDAVLDEGNGNYFLSARDDWYPNMRGALGNYAFYTMTFHTPKNVEVVATGNEISARDEDKQRVSVWQSLMPIPVAGFNLGEFKNNLSEKNKGLQVTSYANVQLADIYKPLVSSGVLGTLSTTRMLTSATSEGDAAIQIYTDFFGPLPYDHVALTQQTACNYGQSWPMLVYLPICYFWDSTVLHNIGVLDQDPTYWQVVTPHEVAHQWWGQTVGFKSYRDQWMSEGFANFSASLFLKYTHKDTKEYRDFWRLMQKRLLEKNQNGLRPVDVGPVTMGARLNSSKTGDTVYQNLVYNKGAYILHSLEMLYWSRQYGEEPFKKAMHDLVTSYRNRPATTEDFKAVMERNMPQWIDIDGNHRLDWFFNAYVYGTAVPRYNVTYEFYKNGDDTMLHFKLTQAEVSDDFKMIVPLYIDLGNDQIAFMGRAMLHGSMTEEHTINLGKLPTMPKRVLVNYNYDLLSEP